MANEEPKLPKQFDLERDLSDIYKWLPLQCNEKPLSDLIEQVQGLSKFAKKEVLKGKNIDDKVRALRKAVGYNLIKQESLEHLLRDCEESGQQWIYLYSPKGKYLDLVSDPHSIAKKLFAGMQLQDFPRFEWPDNGLVWADFRITPSKWGDNWVIKIYEHSKEKKIVESKDGEKIGDDLFQDWKNYRYLDAYSVHVVRWIASLSLLEVRIDKEKSMGRKSARSVRFNGVIDRMLPALPITSMTSWSLESACTKMLKKRTQVDAPFRFGHVRLQNGDKGKSNFFPFDSKSSLDKDKGRKDAVDLIFSNGGKILEGCVNFKVPLGMEKPKPLKEDVDSEVGNDDELRTIIGGDNWNEVSISSRITPTLLDHVLKHLCKTYA